MSFEFRRADFTKAENALVLSLFDELKPPKKVTLSQWAEENFVLPEGSSAKPGKFRLWPYQYEMLDVMGDPTIERVSIIKSARIGFTKGLISAIAATAAVDPCSIILLVPTDDDARGYAVDEIDPSFEASPALRGLIRSGRLDGRNTLTRRSFLGGGSLKILSARSPRNLRRHDAKKLFVDEADGMELTAEGDPILLAEKRTLAHPDRKIVVGSTPTLEGVSVVDKLYSESDQRVFEVPCPSCGTFTEILWPMIRWPDGDPEKAAFLCPHCEELIDERHKPAMVYKGRWRKTRPEVKGHAGFRINTLVSLLANASWAKLAAEFLKAKKSGPADLQVFANTIEGRVWKTSLNSIDASGLASRVESFGVTTDPDTKRSRIPAEVVLITCGADVQDDRIEATLFGWTVDGRRFVLAHFIIDGNTLDDGTWQEFDAFLKTTWTHPNGWKIGIDGTAIDSGGREGRTQKVYDFCQPRLYRRIYAIKGDAGPKPVWRKAQKVKGGSRLFIIGVDQVKTDIIESLALDPISEDGKQNSNAIRLSEDLPDDWFDQVTGEKRAIRYVRNRAIIEFQPRKRGQRVEALDCAVYAVAVRQAPALRSIDLEERSRRVPEPVSGEAKPAPQKRSEDWAAAFNGQ
ncbi:phage terminase large subunit family protein [Microvirga sp. Mcv34]|uniref:phage terminase large subunit family protein n=1 Tax=Microvirga sp. Mcv34 TaxID=2926016 RepID=UPI0021C9B888|nr:phage terminase large subunit family protein [Microvirga sp. Mcv34]